MGCPCHIFYNTARSACPRFSAVTGFDVDDFCMDCYYFFEKSSKRKDVLSEFCEFADVEYREILKHISVRWLSLERAVSRILSQYESLKSYFLSESDSSPRFKRLPKAFSDPMTEVNLIFFHAVMSMFTTPNKMLQREDPSLYIIDDIINSFLKVVQAKFVKARVLKDADDWDKVDYEDPNNQLPANMTLGFLAKQKVQKLLDEGDIAPGDSRKFFNGARAFYTSTVELLSTLQLPLNDPLLKASMFLDFEQRELANVANVEYFIDRFKILGGRDDAILLNKIHEEFLDYQLLNREDIPKSAWQEVEHNINPETKVLRMDVVWAHLGGMSSMATSEPRFPLLSTVARLVFVIPYSNAGEERIFSLINKNKTSSTPSLALDGTLSSIVQVKLAAPDHWPTFEPLKEMLTKAKKATWEYNKRHSSKS